MRLVSMWHVSQCGNVGPVTTLYGYIKNRGPEYKADTSYTNQTMRAPTFHLRCVFNQISKYFLLKN